MGNSDDLKHRQAGPRNAGMSRKPRTIPRSGDTKEEQQLKKDVAELTRPLRRKYHAWLRADPKEFRSIVVQELYRRFPLRVGRRRSTELDEAEKLRAQGMKWNDICIVIEPQYKAWDIYRRSIYRLKVQSGLRNRKVRKKLHARKRRGLTAPANSSASQPASDGA